MGRAPCCDKANVKKGPWSPEEDEKLKSYIEQHGTGGNWIALPQKIGLRRCGKSCRLRWLNYLRPNIKHGGFSEEEDSIICSLYISIGSRWSIIAAQLPGRTDNDIKNYWNTRLKKKLLGKQRKDGTSRRISSLKQEMAMRSKVPPPNQHSMLISGEGPNINQAMIPHWPELPVLAAPRSIQELPRFNDHTSIRKLLIKLGGKFSNDDDQSRIIEGSNSLEFPSMEFSSNHQAAYQPSSSCMVSSYPTCSSNDVAYQVASASSNVVIESQSSPCMEMLQQGPSLVDCPSFVGQCLYSEGLVDGLEFLYGDDMVPFMGTDGEILNYSMAYPHLIPSDNNIGEDPQSQPGFSRDCGYGQFKYPNLSEL